MSGRLAIAAATAALLGAGFLVPGARAQQQDARGWLGIGLQEQLQCRTGAVPGPRPCERMLIVAQVVVNGPADRAGVEPGDTLLAVGGHPLSTPEGGAALSGIRPARPVVLTLGRPQGRAELRVLPTARPDRVERVRGAERPLPAGVPLAPRTPAAARVERRDVVEVQTDGGHVVWIRQVPGAPEAERQVQVRVRVPDSAALDRRIQVARADMEALERRLETEQELLRWVELELGPELRKLQDSVYRQAREQLQSLRRAHRQAARAVAAEARAAPAWRGWAAPANERRLAGAEFEPLGPELAEFFQAERGLLVLRVLPGTPADRIGLRPGDVVFEAGGVEVSSLEELHRVLSERPGPHRLRWNRKGQPQAGTLPR